jgi:hypothetical protein
VNPALRLLLSRYYDGALAPEHLDDLVKSGLTPDTTAAHYVRSIPLSMIRPLVGFDSTEITSALLFPFRSPRGGFLDHVRVKVFPPLVDRKGHALKYLQPKGAAPRLYFTVPAVCELQGTGPLWIIEGEKKALAVCQLGLPAIGISGIEGWHGKGSRDLLPDFDALALSGRTIELVPDADVQTDDAVERGAMRLASALKARGAVVRLVVLPRAVEAA